MINIIGIPPDNAGYCPRCGTDNVDYDRHNGVLECQDCGLIVYMVEGDGSDE